MNICNQRLWKILAIGCVLLLQACASVKNADGRDPWEPMNRSVYNFNEVLDNVAIKPAAKAYTAVLPNPVRTGIHNFVGNLGDVWTLTNTALQLKLQATAETFMRITVNTVFGLGGVLDVATEMRLEKRKEDFGQTLGYWGVKPGPLCGSACFWTLHFARRFGHACRHAGRCDSAVQRPGHSQFVDSHPSLGCAFRLVGVFGCHQGRGP
jgi:hypothetical protein